MNTTRRGFLGLLGIGAAAAVAPKLPAEMPLCQPVVDNRQNGPSPSPLGPEWSLTEWEYDGQTVYRRRLVIQIDVGGTFSAENPDGGVCEFGPSYDSVDLYALADGTQITAPYDVNGHRKLKPHHD